MSNVSNSGTNGTPGVSGVDDGDPGTNGGPGGDAVAVNAPSSDVSNSVSGYGGSGGAGGTGHAGKQDPNNNFAFIGPGGGAGAGGNGGNASANATTTATSTTPIFSGTGATTLGGSGGSSGFPGGGAPPGTGAPGGKGGDTSAVATMTGDAQIVSATVSATAQGGVGGGAYGNGTGGSHPNAGAGGTVTNVSASGTLAGAGTLSVGTVAAAGTSGSGYSGGNGADGVSLSENNTVTGATNGGQLSLSQTVVGGGGGFAGLTGDTTSYGGHAGAGGSAQSTLTFDDRNSVAQSASVSANVTAYGGHGGGTIDGNGASAGSATAGVDLTGASDVTAQANANGGGGGSSGIGRVFGNSGTGSGADGSAATGHATAITTGPSHSANASLQLQGGAGGSGAGSGFHAGSAHGVTASDGSASATANGTGSTASSSAFFIGGDGGRGTQGAAAGNGGDVTVANDATASSDGGSVVLANVARGGAGGGSDAPTSTNVAGGTPGLGGNASATQTLTDTTAASVQSTVTAAGGVGGFASNQTGGAAGTALANATIAAQGDVRLDEVATGGNGGQGVQSSLTLSPAAGGSGGATAESHASATSTSALSASILGRQLTVDSTAVGGTGGTASGFGATGGNGATGIATAFGSDANAASTVAVNAGVIGGSGGAGYNGANGGRGAGAIMNNDVSGQSAGGKLFLAQTANAGSGGSTTLSFGGGSDGGNGGDAGDATSTLAFDDRTTASHTAAAYLSASTTAFAGSGGSNTGGGGTGDGGEATATTNATGLVVDAESNAVAGSGGLISTSQPGSGNGGAGGKATVSAIGSAGNADPNAPISYDTARATAGGGSGGQASGAAFRGGDGGTATVTASMVTTDARDIYVRATANGGGGGGGGNGADAGDGADVSLVNAVSGMTNAGTITFQQDARGGDGGFSDTGQNGVGGNAISKLTFDDQNDATLSTAITSQIDAYAGRAAATSDAEATITGVGTVSANTTANGGNLSTAISSITGRSVSSVTSAHAVDSGNNFVSNLTIDVSTMGDGTAGTVNETAIVGSGQKISAFSVDQQSIATLMAAPVPAPKPFALQTRAATPTTPSPVIAHMELGGGHTSDTTSGAQTTSQNITYAFDASQINGNPDLMLYFGNGTLTGDASAFGSLTLSIFISGSVHSYNQFKTFSSSAAADTFFHNNTIDVGALSTLGTGRISVTVHATETFSAPGGYYFTMQSETPCYCTGTRILTTRGEVAVEDLAIGDFVVTASGEHRPIKWIGTRGYIGRFANANPEVLPICFKSGSLAENVPARDLWVSPKHAMFLDGVLIQAEHLVNGVTITAATRVENVLYWHIELESHDVLIAEGAEAESFVDDNGRGIFHNAHTFGELYPDERRVEAVYCAPRVEGGFVLEAVRQRLAERAGLPVVTARHFGQLRGYVDGYDGLRVWGWAQDLAHPDAPVCLDIVVDGAILGLTYADLPRLDLARAGIGDGQHAFSFMMPRELPAGANHCVTVRRSADGKDLPHSSRLALLQTTPQPVATTQAA